MLTNPVPSEPPLVSSKPRFRAPTGATDSHFHVFGPELRYPLSPNRDYTPPTRADCDAYLTMAETLGIERMVVVNPTPYGTDHRCTIDAIQSFGRHRSRGVALVDESFTSPRLDEMNRQGFCAARVNAVISNGITMDKVPSIVRLIAPVGWHLEVYLEGKELPNFADLLRSQPIPIVIDHIGLIPTHRGVNSHEFKTLLRLLETGRFWVKLCGYRCSTDGPPYADLLEPVRKIIQTAPDRCVWGTDWPHPRREGPLMPDDGKLLDLLFDWADDDHQLRRILVDNPARLYGFEPERSKI